MLIGKHWKIGSDSLNVILYKRKQRTRKITHETYEDWEEVSYFATVANALHELVNQGVRDSQLKDLKTITARIDELHTMIENLPEVSSAT